MPTFLSAGVYHGAMRQAAVQLPAQYLGVLLAAGKYGRAGEAHAVSAHAPFLTEGDMRMVLLLWDATSLKIVEIPIKTTLNNPDFPEKQ